MSDAKTPAEEAEALRTATREAHEAMKDMRTLVREMRDAETRLRTLSGEVFEERIAAQVGEGLAHYGESIGKAIDDATQAVYKRFDTIADLLLGEDKTNARKGRRPIASYAQQIADAREDDGS